MEIVNGAEKDTLATQALLQQLGIASAVILLVSLLLLYFRSRVSSKTEVQGTAASALDQAPAEARTVVHIVFGTQTGTAERFSKQLRSELQSRYGDSTTFEMQDIEDYKAEDRLEGEKLILLLMATYGDGEPTDNAADFYNWLQKAAKAVEEESGDQILKVYFP